MSVIAGTSYECGWAVGSVEQVGWQLIGWCGQWVSRASGLFMHALVSVMCHISHPSPVNDFHDTIWLTLS